MSVRRGNALRIPLKNEHEQEVMRRAGRITALTLVKLGEVIAPGITTGELNAIAEQTIRGLGAIPAFLDYRGFPATACISLNDEVVHGIPGPAKLREGDLVSVDLGSVLKCNCASCHERARREKVGIDRKAGIEGWHSDAAYTYPVGKVSDLAQRMLDIGHGALAAGIAAARPGARIRDIGTAVQTYAESRGASVVRDLCGHGLGLKLHEKPEIPNYPTPAGNIEIVPGMTLAIEPMLNAGSPEVQQLPDGWTFRTVDRSLSVHFEHTVLIRADGPEILTTVR